MIHERDKKASPGYNEIDMVELLEMLGRIAHAKFSGSELDSIELHTKLEYVLDDLVQLIGQVRNEREEDEE